MVVHIRHWLFLVGLWCSGFSYFLLDDGWWGYYGYFALFTFLCFYVCVCVCVFFLPKFSDLLIIKLGKCLVVYYYYCFSKWFFVLVCRPWRWWVDVWPCWGFLWWCIWQGLGPCVPIWQIFGVCRYGVASFECCLWVVLGRPCMLSRRICSRRSWSGSLVTQSPTIVEVVRGRL